MKSYANNSILIFFQKYLCFHSFISLCTIKNSHLLSESGGSVLLVVEHMYKTTKGLGGCFWQKPKSTFGIFGDQNFEFLAILCLFYANFMVRLHEH